MAGFIVVTSSILGIAIFCFLFMWTACYIYSFFDTSFWDKIGDDDYRNSKTLGWKIYFIMLAMTCIALAIVTNT